jgi:hypothetical protein
MERAIGEGRDGAPRKIFRKRRRKVMNTPGWPEKIMKAGEEAVTWVVDRILSRNYLHKRSTCVQEVIASLEMPTRDEADALKEQLNRLNEKVEELSTRLAALNRPDTEDTKAD